MGLLEDVVKAELGQVAAIGIGAIILAPVVLPVVERIMNEIMYPTIQGMAAEAKETVEDLAAEVKAELVSEHAEPAATSNA